MGNYTIALMKDLRTRKTQWSDYIEEIVRIININFDDEELPERVVITQATYPHHFCDIFLPQRNMGYICMLVSIKYLNFTYIGKTM